MHSPLLTGIKRQNKKEIFPSSPSLLKALNIPLNTQQYIAKRNLLLSYKSDEAVVYDSRLRPYQNADVHFLSKLSKGKGVFNEQRTGKTPTTLVTLKVKGQSKNIIIVPKSLILPWTNEYRTWNSDNVFRIKSWWTRKRRLKEYALHPNETLVINYHTLSRDLDTVRKLGPFDAVILDEAHVMRNYVGDAAKTKMKRGKEVKIYDSPAITRAIMDIRKISYDAYALTGTPSPTKAHNIYGILVFLFYDLFSTYQKSINYYFNRFYDHMGHARIDGFQNKFKERELQEFLETFSVQRKRKDVMKWLPEVDYRTLTFEMPKKMEIWHEELERYFETEHIICQEALSVMVKQRQLCVSPEAIGLDMLGEKFEWLLDFIKDYPEKPIIITGFFTGALKILSEKIKKKHALIIGGMSENKRHNLVQKFQAGEYNIIVGNISVLALGLTISRAEEIFIVDPSLIEGENDQIKDRFIATTPEEAEAKEGQMITKLMYGNSIDTKLAKMLAKRASEIDIINDYTKYLNKRREK